MVTPKVSVIIPTYNSDATISRALRSVLNQTVSDFEVIVIDDGSTDKTVEVLRDYELQDQRVRTFLVDKNGGPGPARNIGIQHSRGEFIAFLDSDDFWLPEKLETQIKLFSDKKVIITYTSVLFLNSKGFIKGIIKSRPKVGLKEMYFTNRVTTSSAMFRKDLDGSKMMPAIRNREDYAYWLGLLRKNPGYIVGVPRPLVGYVKIPGSVSSGVLRNIVDSFRMYVHEAKITPLFAVILVTFNVFFKMSKIVSARVSWLFSQDHTKYQMRHDVETCWGR